MSIKNICKNLCGGFVKKLHLNKYLFSVVVSTARDFVGRITTFVFSVMIGAIKDYLSQEESNGLGITSKTGLTIIYIHQENWQSSGNSDSTPLVRSLSKALGIALGTSPRR